jgi:NLI interacting factor-like phosphatase
VSVKVLALDLERTLVSDAFYADPRPGLREFLDFCHARFGRIALFTRVHESGARQVMGDLVRSGHAPAELAARLQYVAWGGDYKDLAFVPHATPTEVVLVDDDGGWVRPDQLGQWIELAGWDGGPDTELARVQAVLGRWLSGAAPESEPGGAPDRGGR